MRWARFVERVGFMLLGALLTAGMMRQFETVHAQEQPFRGGITEDRAEVAAKPIPIRNDIAQAATPIVTLRHFRIQKGKFDEFYAASVTGVWPYFEKIGSRVIGMWKEIHPVVAGADESAEYDDVYLMTRYASVEHWAATRDMASLGGNGPDWEKARTALAFRQSVTVDSSVKFLEGDLWGNPAQFLPGLPEQYQRVDQ